MNSSQKFVIDVLSLAASATSPAATRVDSRVSIVDSFSNHSAEKPTRKIIPAFELNEKWKYYPIYASP